MITQAQVSPFGYTRMADSLLYSINKTGISLLYDRVHSMAGLSNFNSPTLTDTSSAIHFRQAAYELYAIGLASSYQPPITHNPNTSTDALTGSVSPTTPSSVPPPTGRPMPSYQDFDKILNTNTVAFTVPIGVLIYNFHYIDTASIDEGLLGFSSSQTLIDMPNRSRSPFVLKHLFLASPLEEICYGQNVTFRYNPAMFFTNITHNYIALSVSIDNGPAQRISINATNSITFNHLTTGKHLVHFVLHTTQRKINIHCQALLEVRNGVAAPEPYNPTIGSDAVGVGNGNINGSPFGPASDSFFSEFIQATIPFIGYEENTTNTPNLNTKKYGIIQAELVARPAYPDLDLLHNPIIVLDGFDPGDIRKIDNLNGEDGIRELLKYTGGDLVVEYTEKDHDVIIGNFPEGADFIERNAMAVIELIRKVRDKCRPNDKITLVGPSMGGLIARYALSYMEANNENHNCNLFVSFDSPHLGANIPIGLQQFVKFFAEYSSSVSAEKSWDKLKTPAARQQLLHHAIAGSENIKADWYRTQFLANMASVNASGGWPQIPFRVAIASGRGDGQGLGYSQSQKAVEMVVEARNWVKAATFFGKLWGISLITYKSQVYISPDPSSRAKIAHCKFPPFKEKEFWAWGLGSASDLAIDELPGGTFDGFGEVSSMKEFFGKATVTNYLTNHCFIPTLSALAYRKPNFKWSENIINTNLVCSNFTPFQAYYISPTNMSHTKVDLGIANYIKLALSNPDALNNNTQQTGQVAAPTIISSQKHICSGQTIQVSSSIPGDILWSVQSNLSNQIKINGSTLPVISSLPVNVTTTNNNLVYYQQINARIPSSSGCVEGNIGQFSFSTGELKPILSISCNNGQICITNINEIANQNHILRNSNIELTSPQVFFIGAESFSYCFTFMYQTGFNQTNTPIINIKARVKNRWEYSANPLPCLASEYNLILNVPNCTITPAISVFPSVITNQQSFTLKSTGINLEDKPRYTITDSQGKVWQTGTIESEEMDISIQNLPKVSALYQIHLISNTQHASARLGITR